MLDLENTYLINSSFYLDRIVLQFSSELAANELDEENWKIEINGQIFDASSVVRDPGTSTWNSSYPNTATWNNVLKIYVEGVNFNTSDIVKVIYTPSREVATDLQFVAGNLSNGSPLYSTDVWEAEVASNPFYGSDTVAVVDLSTGRILNCAVASGFLEGERYWLPPGPLGNGDFPNSINGVSYLGFWYPPSSYLSTTCMWALLVPAKYAGSPGASAVASKYWMGGTVDIALFQIIQNYYEKSNELSLFVASSAANLNGGTSSDLIYSDGENASNTINAGSGDDTILSDLFFTKDVGGADTIGAGDGDDLVYSGGGNDVITAGNGNDEVDAGAGNDLIVGGNGAGDDKYFGGSGTDTVKYTSALAAISIDLATGIATSRAVGDAAGIGTDTLSDIENIIAGNFDDVLTGNALENRIEAGIGNDTLSGGTGIDTLIGGAGNDTYIIDDGDLVTEAANQGNDTVQSSATHLLGLNVENLVLTGPSAISGTGNLLNNSITGNSASNTLNGGTGVDTLIGGAGDDVYVTDGGDEIIEGLGAGTDIVQSSATHALAVNIENLTLTGSSAVNGTGNSGDNTINGNAGANILDGSAGADTLIGGTGNDTYVTDGVDTITEAASAGTDTVRSSAAYTLGINLENLTLTGSLAINGTGNSANNVINGNSGDNILNGVTGIDTLIGGLGDDTFVTDGGDTITESASAGTDTVQSSATYTLGSNLEKLTLSGTSLINGTGNSSNNVITGNGAANTLNGSTGTDTLIGAAGDDIYVTDGGDTITERSGEGTDTVQASVSFTLGEHLENLTLTGSSAINGSGNSDNNTITGNTGNNILNGGTGADTLIGGTGNDTYVTDGGDTITEAASAGTDIVQSSVTFTLGANIENLTLTGASATNGTGNSLNNSITGNIGNNILDGNTGTDTLIGGTGDDIYITDGGDTITEAASAGTDTVQSSITYTLGTNLENLTLTGSSAINGTGNTLNNVITGNSGNNTLSGGTGTDTLIGGLGNDTYITDGADTITEAASAGTDIVQSSASFTLSEHLENLTLTGSTAINGTGNSGNNTITGNTGANILDGSTGEDTLIGGAGNDTYVTDGGDTITEAASAGTDTVQSSVTFILATNLENLTLTGSSAINGTGNTLNNVVVGNGGENLITAGTGNDTMTGGNGNDTFIFNTIAESGTTATATDVITDFVIGQDKIDLSAIDAFAAAVANDTFIWQDTAAFSSTTQGEVRYQQFDNIGSTNDYTMVWIDNDADTAVEMAIRLTGLFTLTASDFIL